MLVVEIESVQELRGAILLFESRFDFHEELKLGASQGWGSTSNFVDKSTVGGKNGFDPTVDTKFGIDPTSTSTSTS